MDTVPAFDSEAMRSVLGCAESRAGVKTAEWLDETRGRVELPESSP